MTFDELKDKASTLPMEPGVYLMRDKTQTVIYVGKAKRLKNRHDAQHPISRICQALGRWYRW